MYYFSSSIIISKSIQSTFVSWITRDSDRSVAWNRWGIIVNRFGRNFCPKIANIGPRRYLLLIKLDSGKLVVTLLLDWKLFKTAWRFIVRWCLGLFTLFRFLTALHNFWNQNLILNEWLSTCLDLIYIFIRFSNKQSSPFWTCDYFLCPHPCPEEYLKFC